MRILQLSDLHLFADPDERLKGVPTRASFLDIFQIVESRFADVDFLILTGDFTHDEKLETYRYIREVLENWIPRCRLIPGNHDDRKLIRSVFPEIVSEGTGSLNFSIQAENWRLIGLDSHWPDEVAGRIENDQLDWLENELEQHSNAPSVIFMHHPPVPVGSEWLDRIGLQEPDRFQQIVKSSPQVRVVCTGHVHQEFTGRLGQADVFTTPSTGVQFTPREAKILCDSIPPGFRVFTFEGEEFRTEVIRLPELKYPPMME